MELNDNSPPTLLVVLADFPGGHYRVAELLGNRLRSEGVRVAYLLTSPYVKRFKKVNLESVGPVYHLSDLRKAPADTDPQPASQWWMHPSFVRQEYYRGRSLVAPTDYGPIRHAIETVFDDLGKVDLVWSEPPTSATLCVLHDVCGARDVPYWGIGPARVPGHFHIYIKSC